MKQAIHHIRAAHARGARQVRDQAGEWKALKAPTLVLWTDNDPTATVAGRPGARRCDPRLEVRGDEDCGHWPQFEDADTFNRIHIDFLRKQA